MTLVLLWRVPARGVTTRWRGPEGLAPAIEREPSIPVAAVVGPPGTGGAVSFPPMAVSADATAPVPANGVGSVGWSTVIAAPVIWDGVRWRSFAFFCVPPDVAPDWVPVGALAVSDFAEDRYWRSDIGICSYGDLWTVDPANWYPYDPATAVVPGVGLTTGEVSTINTPRTIQAPVSTPELWALIAAAGGCAAYGEYEQTTSVPYGADDIHGFTVGLCYELPGYSIEIGSFVTARVSAGIPADKMRHVATAWAGGDYANTHTDIDLPARAANSMDFVTGTTLCSVDGATVPGKLGAGDYSALNTLAFEVSLTNAYGDKTMQVACARHVIYPPMDQAALNALTAVETRPDLDFMGSLPAGASFARASSGTWFDDAGTIQLASADEPRFGHDPVTHALRGLLIEPAATNLMPYSADLASWSANSITFESPMAAPDGTLTFYEMVSQGSDHTGAFIAIATTAGDSLSLFARKGTANYATISNGTVWAQFDLDAGAVHSSSGGTASVEDFGARLYRCKLADITAGDSYVIVQVVSAATDAEPWNGGATSNTGEYVYVWGVQVEADAVPTSYIPTSAATATRAADELTITVPAGKTTAHCLLFGGSVDVPVSEGQQLLTAADFDGVPVWLQGITFS